MPEITVCKVGDVAPGSAIRVDADGHRLAIIRVGEDWYALDDRCSHAEASLPAAGCPADASPPATPPERTPSAARVLREMSTFDHADSSRRPRGSSRTL